MGGTGEGGREGGSLAWGVGPAWGSQLQAAGLQFRCRFAEANVPLAHGASEVALDIIA